jgi:hypothetical protein
MADQMHVERIRSIVVHQQLEPLMRLLRRGLRADQSKPLADPKHMRVDWHRWLAASK